MIQIEANLNMLLLGTLILILQMLQQSEALPLLQPAPVSRKAHRKSSSVDDTPAAAITEAPDKAEKKAKRKRKARQAQPVIRNVLFVHVRINRLHCRVTYQVRKLIPLPNYSLTAGVCSSIVKAHWLFSLIMGSLL